MTTYFDHVSKATSWEVLDLPAAIEVDETITDELLREFEKWTQTHTDFSVAQPSGWSVA
jgi:hypothetical protein